MPAIFISHATTDSVIANEVKDWLADLGYENVFLAFDKARGIGAGENWEQRLYREIDRCQAIVIIETPAWLDSKWCFVEYTHARSRGKTIFPIVAGAAGTSRVAPEIQSIHYARWEDEGRRYLAAGLRAVTDEVARGFIWDPKRPPYPGMLAFEREDAAVFFGRDEEIRDIARELDAARVVGGERLLLVLGASGSGKSSLVKAGVLPWIARDVTNWLVLPPFRPERDPLSALAKVFAEALMRPTDWQAWRQRLAAEECGGALLDFCAQARVGLARNATVLVTIDQFEEALTSGESVERNAFLTVLHAALGRQRMLPIHVIATLRSDVFSVLLEMPEMADVPLHNYPLRPMPLDRIEKVIAGPASVASIALELGLVDRIVREIPSADTLPLLAFMLRELHDQIGPGRNLTIEDYESIGDAKADLSPLDNTVRRAAEAAIERAVPTPETLAALRDAFFPALVRVEGDRYLRRAAHLPDLPPDATQLIEALVAARLMTKRVVDGQGVVEVTHEALFTAWPLLARWIVEERDFLIGYRQIEEARAAWLSAAPKEKEGALLRGLLLSRAREWLRAHPIRLRALHDFIRTSIAFDDADRDHDAAIARRQALMQRVITWGSLAAALVLAILGSVLWTTLGQVSRERDRTAQALFETEAQRARAETAQNTANQQRQLAQQAQQRSEADRDVAQVERKRAEEQRELAKTAQANAEAERDRTQEALLVAAARESLLLTRDSRPEEGWRSLRKALSLAKDRTSSRLPRLMVESGLTALIENRYGPELVLEPSDRSKTAAKDQEDKEATVDIDPTAVAAFDPKGAVIAVGKLYDVAIWSTADGTRKDQFVVAHKVKGLYFNDRGDILIVVGEADATARKTIITLVDISTRRQRAYDLKLCRSLVPCVADSNIEKTRLVDILKYDRLTETVRTGASAEGLLVPFSLSEEFVFAGVIGNRYYVFLKWRQEGESRSSTIIIFDNVSQQTIFRNRTTNGYTHAAVAKNSLLFVAGASQRRMLDVYKIVPDSRNGAKFSFQLVKELEARDSSGTKDVALNDEGTVLYYSNNRWGTGGGTGARLSAAIEVQSRREVWANTFDGYSVFGPKQALIARSSLKSAQSVGTDFVDARTSQRLFSVDGTALAFDPTARMALVEMRSNITETLERNRATATQLRLVELSSFPSFANQAWLPRITGRMCSSDTRAFQTLATRQTRLWNPHDWRRLPTTPAARQPVRPGRESRRRLEFEWSGNVLEVTEEQKVIAKGSRDEVIRIIKVLPETAMVIEPQLNMTIVEVTSPDRQWMGLLKQTADKFDWKLFKLSGNERQLVRFEKGKPLNEWTTVTRLGMTFLPHVSVVAIQNDECTVDLLGLPNVTPIGRIHAAFDRITKVEQISDDLIALHSEYEYLTIDSIQILSYPELEHGPWFLSGGVSDHNWDTTSQVADADKEAAAKNALFPHGSHGVVEFGDNGRTLIVQNTGLLRETKRHPIALSVPPWGKRLRDLMAKD